jgi:hypothetical protein
LKSNTLAIQESWTRLEQMRGLPAQSPEGIDLTHGL